MRKAQVFVNGILAGVLQELPEGAYRFTYNEDYFGTPVSLTMPLKSAVYEYQQFPPLFEGLLPEGAQLDALLRKYKLDKNDYLDQLIQVGNDLVGAITVKEIT